MRSASAVPHQTSVLPTVDQDIQRLLFEQVYFGSGAVLRRVLPKLSALKSEPPLAS